MRRAAGPVAQSSWTWRGGSFMLPLQPPVPAAQSVPIASPTAPNSALTPHLELPSSWLSASWHPGSGHTQPQCTFFSGPFSSHSFNLIYNWSITLPNHTPQSQDCLLKFYLSFEALLPWSDLNSHASKHNPFSLWNPTTYMLFTSSSSLSLCFSEFVLWSWIFLSDLSNKLSEGCDHLTYFGILYCIVSSTPIFCTESAQHRWIQ